MTNRLYIREDISDWQDEAFRAEIIITNERDMLDALASGSHTAQVARAAIVSRELGKAPEDIMRPNKVLLTIGAMQDVISTAHKVKIEVETSNGAVYEAPAFVGKGNKDEAPEETEEKDPEDTGPSFVAARSPLALERARRYMSNVVPGHVWNRLLLIHHNGGSVQAEAEELKAKIDEMVNRIA